MLYNTIFSMYMDSHKIFTPEFRFVFITRYFREVHLQVAARFCIKECDQCAGVHSVTS